MQRPRNWLVFPLTAAIAACGSSSITPPSPDASVVADLGVDTAAIIDRPTQPDSVVIPDTSVPPPEDVPPGVDLGPTEDLVAPPDDVVTPPDDAVTPPDDVVTPPTDTVTPPTDTVTPPTDTVTPPADAPPDTCANGLTEACPMTPPGPCTNLNDGMAHSVIFRGLRHNIPLSCAGTMTGSGPDGIIPLTLTAASDVTIVGIPTGDDAILVGLSQVAGCGTAGAELRCSNSSAPGAGGTATVTLSGLAAGTYYVVVASGRGNPAVVQAMITPPRPRTPGDVCPGVAIVPDGAPTTLRTAGFAQDDDHGTTCSGGPSGRTDSVFSYTLTATRDVTVSLSGSGTEGVGFDVETTCGARSSALTACVSGNPATRLLRAQPAGTYYVIVDHRSVGAAGRTLIAQVTTAMPTAPSPAARCPGVPLPAPATTVTADLAALPLSGAITCLTGQRSTGYFSFNAAGDADVLVNVSSTTGSAALQLQRTCGGATVGACDRVGSSVWRRYSGLTAGTHTALAGTTSDTGRLSVAYYTTAASTPAAVAGSPSCMAPRVLPEAGGVFTGSTAAGDRFASAGCAPRCGAGRGVTYRLTLTARRRVVASLTSNSMGYDPLLFIQAGDTCPGRTMMEACNDDTYGQNSQVDATLNAGTYWVTVGGCGMASAGNYTFDLATLAP